MGHQAQVIRRCRRLRGTSVLGLLGYVMATPAAHLSLAAQPPAPPAAQAAAADAETPPLSAVEENPIAEGVDLSPLPVRIERAFPQLRIERPINITHAGDGSDRLFIGSQLGPIYSIATTDEQVEEPDLFIDLTDRVTYRDNQNEEGLLGLAFHPDFAAQGNQGEFFVYYTSRREPNLSVVSRFRVLAGDPTRGDPESEQVLLELKQPFWNHNGGTLCFGPDGYLYIGLGDGGSANDPLRSGQDLTTWLGKILRIDVNRSELGRPYAIPPTNPFAGLSDARPEIYAYGLRNVWRMAFDRLSGRFWVADVGQSLWEEINLVEAGGNYGWSVREGRHPFYQQPGEDVSGLIDPIWEYPHTDQWGKSITGGLVYRGREVPSLWGYYLHADYVTGKVWALKYDEARGEVTENRELVWPPALPVVTFGEDEQGEVYMSTTTSGGMIFRFVEGEASP